MSEKNQTTVIHRKHCEKQIKWAVTVDRTNANLINSTIHKKSLLDNHGHQGIKHRKVPWWEYLVVRWAAAMLASTARAQSQSCLKSNSKSGLIAVSSKTLFKLQCLSFFGLLYQIKQYICCAHARDRVWRPQPLLLVWRAAEQDVCLPHSLNEECGQKRAESMSRLSLMEVGTRQLLILYS